MNRDYWSRNARNLLLLMPIPMTGERVVTVRFPDAEEDTSHIGFMEFQRRGLRERNIYLRQGKLSDFLVQAIHSISPEIMRIESTKSLREYGGVDYPCRRGPYTAIACTLSGIADSGLIMSPSKRIHPARGITLVGVA